MDKNSKYPEQVCDVCGQETQVTEPRDFFYPDFTIQKVVTKVDYK